MVRGAGGAGVRALGPKPFSGKTLLTCREGIGKPIYFRHEIMVESRAELDHEAVLHYVFYL